MSTLAFRPGQCPVEASPAAPRLGLPAGTAVRRGGERADRPVSPVNRPAAGPGARFAPGAPTGLDTDGCGKVRPRGRQHPDRNRVALGETNLVVPVRRRMGGHWWRLVARGQRQSIQPDKGSLCDGCLLPSRTVGRLYVRRGNMTVA